MKMCEKQRSWGLVAAGESSDWFGSSEPAKHKNSTQSGGRCVNLKVGMGGRSSWTVTRPYLEAANKHDAHVHLLPYHSMHPGKG